MIQLCRPVFLYQLEILMAILDPLYLAQFIEKYLYYRSSKLFYTKQQFLNVSVVAINPTLTTYLSQLLAKKHLG